MPRKPSARRLRRNLRRKKLGGVCAGLADFTGFDVTLLRFLFVLFTVFGGVGFWLYVILWMVLPAGADAPMPEVSWRLERELRRIDAKLRKLHKKHEPALADLAQEAFDAIKILAPDFEAGGGGRAEAALARTALADFPRLLDQILGLPAAAFVGAPASDSGPAGVLVGQLNELRAELLAAVNERMAREFRAGVREHAAATPELAEWREQLRPLQERLRERAGAATSAALAGIEEKLAFLLERLGEGSEVLDLRPFEVRKIAFEYLPDTLNQYLALPPAMARSERLNSGKTAEESLNDQLHLLDTTLHDLAKSLFEQDATGLLVHGRFLKEKFAEQPFRLEE